MCQENLQLFTVFLRTNLSRNSFLNTVDAEKKFFFNVKYVLKDQETYKLGRQNESFTNKEVLELLQK